MAEDLRDLHEHELHRSQGPMSPKWFSALLQLPPTPSIWGYSRVGQLAEWGPKPWEVYGGVCSSGNPLWVLGTAATCRSFGLRTVPWKPLCSRV